MQGTLIMIILLSIRSVEIFPQLYHEWESNNELLNQMLA